MNGTLSGTLYIVVEIAGTAVLSPPAVVLTGPNTGQATVRVPPPSTLGTGTHRSTIRVRACVNDQTCGSGQLQGSPQTIEVTYAIGSATPADAVVPRVVPVAEGGEVVLRGSLEGATAVSFGSTPATSVTVVSNTELRATYPALAAGTYPVIVNGGSLPFTGALIAVSSPAFTTQPIQHPRAGGNVSRVIFDAERNALLVAANFPGPTNTGELWRYTFSGSTWSAPAVMSVPHLEDIALSLDGTRLFTVTEDAILELDPVSLATLRSVPAPMSPVINLNERTKLHYIAFANDGTAIVSSHPDGIVGHSPLFYYFPSVGAFRDADFVYSHPLGWYPTLSSSGDGSRVLVGLGGLSPAPLILQYQTATRAIAETTVRQNVSRGHPLVTDRFARRIGVLTVFAATLYDQNFNTLGNLPVVPLAMSINPAGTRAIALTGDSVRTFNIDTVPFAEVGSPATIVPPSAAQVSIKTAMTPDGKTVFYTGDTQTVVVPLP